MVKKKENKMIIMRKEDFKNSVLEKRFTSVNEARLKLYAIKISNSITDSEYTQLRSLIDEVYNE